MLSASYGDIAQYTFLRLRNSELKSNVQTLGQELTTGRTSNPTERLGGDFTYLAGIEHTLSQLDSYQVAATEVTVLTVSMQAGMDKLQQNVAGLRDDIFALTPALSGSVSAELAQDARDQLGNSLSVLNSNVGGRSLFAGTATKTSAVADTDTIMAALVTEISGLTTAADIIDAVDNWFFDPAGFESIGYLGSANALAPIDVGTSDEVFLDVKADNDAFKQTLKGFALAALTQEPGVTIGDDVKVELVRATGNELAVGNDALINLQADVGFMQERIEKAQTRNQAERTSLGITKNEMLEADAFETYSALEEAENQLQALYTVTQRSFDLTLLRFLR